MSKIALNFFGEIVSVEKPQSLASLRNDIARLFFFSSQDAEEILLTYNDNGDKLIISSDEDLKAFLNSKNTMIDLDICQNSKIYKDNLNQLQEETKKDKDALEQLLKKRDELNKLKETKFAPEREEMKKIQQKIMELCKEKHQIRKKIFEGVREIEKEKRENEKKIEELQKKLGIKEEKPKKVTLKKMKPFHPFMRFAPPFLGNTNNNFHKFFPHHHHKFHHKKPFEVKFGNTEYIDIPKDTSANKTESNDFDLKMRTIDDWGKCLLNKTQEITNKLAETFKGFPTLNISLNNEEDKKEDSKEKKEQLIHRNIICDGCEMRPLIGKRYKCKECKDFDYCEDCYKKNKESHKHEFNLINKPEVPKFHKINPFFRHSSKKNMTINPFKPEIKPKIEKLQHCKTMGNIFEKDKISNKVMHFGVKCDGCGAFPIVGCRFKCAVCDNFDYCEECENKLSEKHDHPFLKIYEPKMNPIFFKCVSKK